MLDTSLCDCEWKQGLPSTLTVMVKIVQDQKTIANKEYKPEVIFKEFAPSWRAELEKRRHLG